MSRRRVNKLRKNHLNVLLPWHLPPQFLEAFFSGTKAYAALLSLALKISGHIVKIYLCLSKVKSLVSINKTKVDNYQRLMINSKDIYKPNNIKFAKPSGPECARKDMFLKMFQITLYLIRF